MDLPRQASSIAHQARHLDARMMPLKRAGDREAGAFRRQTSLNTWCLRKEEIVSKVIAECSRLPKRNDRVEGKNDAGRPKTILSGFGLRILATLT